ncbi:MAG: hypothetical protein ACK56I_01665, partial [bacterium]
GPICAAVQIIQRLLRLDHGGFDHPLLELRPHPPAHEQHEAKEGQDHDDDDGKEKGKDNSASTFAGRCPPTTADKLKHFFGVRDAYHSVLLEAGVHMPGMKQRDFM